MLNLVTGILFSVLLFPSNLSNSCDDYWENHPVRSDITMQIVLKSYGYYEGKIDGIFGNVSKQALISLQKSNNIDADGKIGPQTCTLLLNKQNIVKLSRGKKIKKKGYKKAIVTLKKGQSIDLTSGI